MHNSAVSESGMSEVGGIDRDMLVHRYYIAFGGNIMFDFQTLE